MKLTVFNGSPRGRKSNTKVLLEQFLNGFATSSDNTYEVFYLNRVKEADWFVKAFKEAKHVVIAFPLYTDCMPAMVKTFIESLAPLRGRRTNPRIGFIIQSGFPEGIHSTYVERYCKKFASAPFAFCKLTIR